MEKKLQKENLSLPLIVAPMFLISGPELVIECCKNGVVGTFPALNQRNTEGFEEWIVLIKKELAEYEAETGKKAAPFGVNLIVHPTNPRLMADLQVVVKHQVPLVITSLGAVSDLVSAIQAYGGQVYHDVIKKRHAQKAAEAGVDGLILVTAGAGGHAGLLNPMAFIDETRQFFDKTIILSGCISTGANLASAIQMGADYGYAGTRFINTLEAKAEAEYQQMIVDSGCSDIIYTAAVSGVYANFLKQSLENAGIGPEQWESSAKIDFGKELDAAKAEQKAWKTIWSAGQGVANVHDVLSTNNLIQRFKEEYKNALSKQADLFNNLT